MDKTNFFTELAHDVAKQGKHLPSRPPQEGIVNATINIATSEVKTVEQKQKEILHLMEFYYQILEPMCICQDVRIRIINEIPPTHEEWRDEGTDERPIP